MFQKTRISFNYPVLAGFLWPSLAGEGKEPSSYCQVEVEIQVPCSAFMDTSGGTLVTCHCIEVRALAPHMVSTTPQWKARRSILPSLIPPWQGCYGISNTASWGCKSRLPAWPLLAWMRTQLFLWCLDEAQWLLTKSFLYDYTIPFRFAPLAEESRLFLGLCLYWLALVGW